MTEFVCCYCPNLFEADADGPQDECPQCGQFLPTERRDHWENRDDHGYDDLKEAIKDDGPPWDWASWEDVQENSGEGDSQ